MATQPTRSIRWATDGGADIVEPSGGERDIGWTDGQKPPAEYFNYLMRGYYDWQQFFITELLQRDGSVPITGLLRPAVDGGVNLASSSFRFSTAFAREFNATLRVTSPNTVKAWAVVTTDGSGGLTISEQDSAGGAVFTTLAFTGSAGSKAIIMTMSVTLDPPYVVLLTYGGADGGRIVTAPVAAQTGTQFSIFLEDSTGNIGLDDNAATIFIAVVGKLP